MQKGNGKLLKKIVSLLVEKPNWPREMKIAKKISQTFQDEEFWETLSKEYPKKLPSLAFFLTEKGKVALFKNKTKKALEKRAVEPIILKEEKIGEDKPIKNRVKTLKDFLKNG